MLDKRFSRTLVAVLLCLCASAGFARAQTVQSQPNVAGTRLAELVSPSVVLILTGKGGQLEGIGSGLIVRADGVVLTAYHLVKDAREVQVRLKNGEVYDKVELIGHDERRDVAALRLPAVGLPVLPRMDAAEIRVGEPVYVVSNPKHLPWTISDGILSGVRLADDVPGAGSGYKLLQHTAPVSAGSSGGVLVDANGRGLGLVVASAGQNLNFAVPFNSLMGLANAQGRMTLGAGTDLRLPEPARPPVAAAVLKTDPNEILRAAKIVHVSSKTSFFEAVLLQNELRKQADFVAWGIAMVDGYEGYKVADIHIEIDRPLFTYTFTYKLTDARTKIILATGKLTAFDGNGAAPKLAKRIAEDIRKVRQPPLAKEAKANAPTEPGKND
jgi:hypothetical protein